MVLVLLVELKLIGGWGLILSWGAEDDGHKEGGDGEDLEEI